MSAPEVYYFGCWGGLGHYLWTPGGRTRNEERMPWSLRELDGSLAGDPALADARRPGHWSDQPEGVVRLHHRAGWTAIAFWDRSQDQRGNSNSAFLARGDLTGEEMIERFELSFPAVWQRITGRFPLVLSAAAPSSRA